MKVYCLLLLLLFEGTVQATTIEQITAGSYSPAVAGVTGSVHVTYNITIYNFSGPPITSATIFSATGSLGNYFPWLPDSKNPLGLTNLSWPSGSDPTFDSKITISSYPGSLPIVSATPGSSSALLGSGFPWLHDSKNLSAFSSASWPMTSSLIIGASVSLESGSPLPRDAKNSSAFNTPMLVGSELTAPYGFKGLSIFDVSNPIGNKPTWPYDSEGLLGIKPFNLPITSSVGSKLTIPYNPMSPSDLDVSSSIGSGFPQLPDSKNPVGLTYLSYLRSSGSDPLTRGH